MKPNSIFGALNYFKVNFNSNNLIGIIIGLMFFTSTSIAQNYKKLMYDNNVNFYMVVNEAENYFIGKGKGKGSGWKGFQRWATDNEYKYYPSGNRSNVVHY